MIPEDHNPLLPESYLDPSRDPISVPGIQPQELTPAVITPDEIPPPIFGQFPEDLRAPWSWFDLLILVGITFIGTFLISVVLVAVFAAFGLGPAALQKSTN